MASAAPLVRAGSTTLLALLFCQAAAAAKTDDVAPSKAEARAFDSTDPAEAMRLATIAAAAGLRDAQMMLGDRYLRSEDQTKDVERAIEWLRRAAAQGSARAQSELGWIYSGGIEGKLDTAEALKWFTVAARQEDAYSLARLAEFYHRGIAVERDEPRAKRLTLRSAALGDRNGINAAWNLLLFARTPDDRNPRLGLHFLFKGANADEPNSVYMLAREYLIGRDVARDPARAVQWFTRAAKNKHPLGTLWLSELHAKGIGVPRDRKKGEQLLQAALRDAELRDRNLFSWALSVGPDDQLRNAALAIRVLEPALAAEQQKAPAYLDTLAAAYAENGQFDKAVVTQSEAIETLRRARPTEPSPPMQQRLELYRAGKTYREETVW